MFKAPNQYRFREGKLKSEDSYGPNGVFYIPLQKKLPGLNKFILIGNLQVIASDGMGWEHCSVCVVSQDKKRFLERTPTWEEMDKIKNLFWDPVDAVVQFHPPDADKVNLHPYVLHLWRRIGSVYEVPLKMFV